MIKNITTIGIIGIVVLTILLIAVFRFIGGPTTIKPNETPEIGSKISPSPTMQTTPGITPGVSPTPAVKITGVKTEKVFYDSQGLKIEGVICRPQNEGKFPLIALNHGGVAGLGPKFSTLCEDLVKEGYVVLMSQYRGEGKSQGNIELCKGEVDDVLNFIEYAKTKPYADSSRIGMAGFSHGGCITLNAVARSQEIDAAVDFYGPTDFTALYTYFENLGGIKGEIKELFDFIGGTPAEKQGEYRVRSAITKVSQINTPLLILHGTADNISPIEQSRALVDELKKAGKTYEYKEYKGQGHGFTGSADADSWQKTKEYLTRYLK